MLKQVFRIGIDVGGTFTDGALLQNGTVIASCKIETTDDIAIGIRNIIKGLLANQTEAENHAYIVTLGTTQLLNTILEYRCQKTAIIRLAYPESTAIAPFKNWPERFRDSFGGIYYIAKGGYEFDGRELSPISEDELKAIAEELKGKGIQFVAISGIFSHVYPQQELAAKAIINQYYPECICKLSHQIGGLGLIERENATALNASLMIEYQKIADSLRSIVSSLNLQAQCYLTQSDGSLANIDDDSMPIACLGSGQINSILGGHILTGIRDAVVVDIGGTSTDIGLLRNGLPQQRTSHFDIHGVSCRFPSPNIHSVALGGGTVIRIDALDFSFIAESVGKQLTKASRVFGGNQLTITDIAVANGIHIKGADPDKVKIDPEHCRVIYHAIHRRLVREIITFLATVKQKPSKLVLVGGGALLLDREFLGKELATVFENILIPSHADVANAIGATASKITGKHVGIYDYTKQTRADVLRYAEEKANENAMAAGAIAETLIKEQQLEERINYLEGDFHQVTIKVFGQLSAVLQARSVDRRQFDSQALHIINNKQFPALPTGMLRFDAQEQDSAPSFLIGSPNLRYLSRQQVEDIAVGCDWISSGGGGSSMVALEAMPASIQIAVISLKDIPDDSWVVACGIVGSPTIAEERILSRTGMKQAILVLEKQLGVNFSAILPAEIGGANGIYPLVLMEDMHKVVLDADCMGRAFPALHMVTPNIYGDFKVFQAVLSNAQHTIYVKAQSFAELEAKVRSMIEQLGGVIFMGFLPMTGKQAKATCIANSLSITEALGYHIRTSLQSGTASWQIINNYLRTTEYGEAQIKFSGKIIDIRKKEVDGFSIGGLILSQGDQYVAIGFQNENLLLKKASLGSWETIAQVPTIITLIDRNTFRAIPCGQLRIGQDVMVICLNAPALMLTEKALAVVGPDNYPLAEIIRMIYPKEWQDFSNLLDELKSSGEITKQKEKELLGLYQRLPTELKNIALAELRKQINLFESIDSEEEAKSQRNLAKIIARLEGGKHPRVYYILHEISVLEGFTLAQQDASESVIRYDALYPDQPEEPALVYGRKLLVDSKQFKLDDFYWHVLQMREDSEKGEHYAKFEEHFFRNLQITENGLHLKLNCLPLISIKEDGDEAAFVGKKVDAFLDYLDKVLSACISMNIEISVHIQFVIGDTLQAYNTLNHAGEVDPKERARWEERGKAWVDTVKPKCEILKARFDGLKSTYLLNQHHELQIEFLHWTDLLSLIHLQRGKEDFIVKSYEQGRRDLLEGRDTKEASFFNAVHEKSDDYINRKTKWPNRPSKTKGMDEKRLQEDLWGTSATVKPSCGSVEEMQANSFLKESLAARYKNLFFINKEREKIIFLPFIYPYPETEKESLILLLGGSYELDLELPEEKIHDIMKTVYVAKEKAIAYQQVMYFGELSVRAPGNFPIYGRNIAAILNKLIQHPCFPIFAIEQLFKKMIAFKFRELMYVNFSTVTEILMKRGEMDVKFIEDQFMRQSGSFDRGGLSYDSRLGRLLDVLKIIVTRIQPESLRDWIVTFADLLNHEKTYVRENILWQLGDFPVMVNELEYRPLVVALTRAIFWDANSSMRAKAVCALARLELKKLPLIAEQCDVFMRIIYLNQWMGHKVAITKLKILTESTEIRTHLSQKLLAGPFRPPWPDLLIAQVACVTGAINFGHHQNMSVIIIILERLVDRETVKNWLQYYADNFPKARQEEQLDCPCCGKTHAIDPRGSIVYLLGEFKLIDDADIHSRVDTLISALDSGKVAGDEIKRALESLSSNNADAREELHRYVMVHINRRRNLIQDPTYSLGERCQALRSLLYIPVCANHYFEGQLQFLSDIFKTGEIQLKEVVLRNLLLLPCSPNGLLEQKRIRVFIELMQSANRALFNAIKDDWSRYGASWNYNGAEQEVKAGIISIILPVIFSDLSQGISSSENTNNNFMRYLLMCVLRCYWAIEVVTFTEEQIIHMLSLLKSSDAYLRETVLEIVSCIKYHDDFIKKHGALWISACIDKLHQRLDQKHCQDVLNILGDFPVTDDADLEERRFERLCHYARDGEEAGTRLCANQALDKLIASSYEKNEIVAVWIKKSNSFLAKGKNDVVAMRTIFPIMARMWDTGLHILDPAIKKAYQQQCRDLEEIFSIREGKTPETAQSLFCYATRLLAAKADNKGLSKIIRLIIRCLDAQCEPVVIRYAASCLRWQGLWHEASATNVKELYENLLKGISNTDESVRILFIEILGESPNSLPDFPSRETSENVWDILFSLCKSGNTKKLRLSACKVLCELNVHPHDERYHAKVEIKISACEYLEQDVEWHKHNRWRKSSYLKLITEDHFTAYTDIIDEIDISHESTVKKQKAKRSNTHYKSALTIKREWKKNGDIVNCLETIGESQDIDELQKNLATINEFLQDDTHTHHIFAMQVLARVPLPDERFYRKHIEIIVIALQSSSPDARNIAIAEMANRAADNANYGRLAMRHMTNKLYLVKDERHYLLLLDVLQKLLHSDGIVFSAGDFEEILHLVFWRRVDLKCFSHDSVNKSQQLIRSAKARAIQQENWECAPVELMAGILQNRANHIVPRKVASEVLACFSLPNQCIRAAIDKLSSDQHGKRTQAIVRLGYANALEGEPELEKTRIKGLLKIVVENDQPSRQSYFCSLDYADLTDESDFAFLSHAALNNLMVMHISPAVNTIWIRVLEETVEADDAYQCYHAAQLLGLRLLHEEKSEFPKKLFFWLKQNGRWAAYMRFGLARSYLDNEPQDQKLIRICLAMLLPGLSDPNTQVSVYSMRAMQDYFFCNLALERRRFHLLFNNTNAELLTITSTARSVLMSLAQRGDMPQSVLDVWVEEIYTISSRGRKDKHTHKLIIEMLDIFVCKPGVNVDLCWLALLYELIDSDAESKKAEQALIKKMVDKLGVSAFHRVFIETAAKSFLLKQGIPLEVKQDIVNVLGCIPLQDDKQVELDRLRWLRAGLGIEGFDLMAERAIKNLEGKIYPPVVREFLLEPEQREYLINNVNSPRKQDVMSGFVYELGMQKSFTCMIHSSFFYSRIEPNQSEDNERDVSYNACRQIILS